MGLHTAGGGWVSDSLCLVGAWHETQEEKAACGA
jgi:hypothetical protein